MKELLEVTSSGILLGATYALISVGMAIPLNVFGIVNLGHGALVLSGPLFIIGFISHSPSLELLVHTIILLGLWVALWYLGYKRLISESAPQGERGMGILVMGIGILIVLEETGLKVAPGGTIILSLGTGLPQFSQSLPTEKALIFISVLCIYLFLSLFLRHSDLGRSVLALSEDKMASILLGINPQKIYILVFWSSLLLTIFSGIILSFTTPIQPHWALMLTIKSLLIISLSRRFKLLDTFFISIFLGVSETFANFYLGQELKTILMYSIFILITKLGQDILVKYHEEV